MIKDELFYHEKVYVGSLMQMQEIMDIVDEKYYEKMILPPTVIIQGEKDKVSDAINAIRFY
jgi:hypothetical protein